MHACARSRAPVCTADRIMWQQLAAFEPSLQTRRASGLACMPSFMPELDIGCMPARFAGRQRETRSRTTRPRSRETHQAIHTKNTHLKTRDNSLHTSGDTWAFTGYHKAGSVRRVPTTRTCTVGRTCHAVPDRLSESLCMHDQLRTRPRRAQFGYASLARTSYLLRGVTRPNVHIAARSLLSF